MASEAKPSHQGQSEAELFGFEAGASTDARRPKPGLFEAASGSMLFLDGIDTLPLQAKLLKASEGKHVRRLVVVAEHAMDVKLIWAGGRGDGKY